MRATTISWILEQLSPSRCIACDEAVRRDTAFCGLCVATVERSTHPHSPFLYGGAIARALTRLKYEVRRDLGPVLGQLLVLGLGEALDEPFDLVAPVPLHRDKLSERGYNQCVWLSRTVAEASNAEHSALLLRRTRNTEAQAQLGLREREFNVNGAFAVRARGGVEGRSVMIVDDVRTTGATLRACEAALYDGGATRVRMLSLCMTPR